MDDMKISFKVEVTACEMGPGYLCPFNGFYIYESTPGVKDIKRICRKAEAENKYQEARIFGLLGSLSAFRKVYEENKNGLTPSCPMVKEQFERFE